MDHYSILSKRDVDRKNSFLGQRKHSIHLQHTNNNLIMNLHVPGVTTSDWWYCADTQIRPDNNQVITYQCVSVTTRPLPGSLKTHTSGGARSDSWLM